MTPDSDFFRGRVAGTERPAAGSRTLAVLLAAAGLLLPVAGLRADTTGTRDSSFNAGPLGTTVYALDYVVDANRTIKVTVGGDRGLGAYLLTGDADVQPDGTASSDFFLPDFGNAARIIYTIVPERAPVGDATLPNLLFGGSFNRGTGQTASQNIVRITPIGALDASFATNVGTGANGFVTAILPLADGRIVVGGQFTTFNRESRRRIVRLQNSGSIDESFATGSNIDNDVITLAESLDPSTGQADGRTLVGGIFNNVAGRPYGKLARLDSNGNLDMSFHPSIDLRVLSILVQSDGKIIIGGDFTRVNGVAVNHIARLKYDGSLDPTFAASVTGVPNKDVNPTAVYVLKPLPDGRIYVGGEFAQINGTPRVYLGLISADGILDTTFNPGTAVYNSVQTIAIQSDYKLLIGETLGPKIGKQIQPSLIRLIGAVPGDNAVGTVTQQQVQPDLPEKEVKVPSGGRLGRADWAAHVYLW